MSATQGFDTVVPRDKAFTVEARCRGSDAISSLIFHTLVMLVGYPRSVRAQGCRLKIQSSPKRRIEPKRLPTMKTLLNAKRWNVTNLTLIGEPTDIVIFLIQYGIRGLRSRMRIIVHCVSCVLLDAQSLALNLI